MPSNPGNIYLGSQLVVGGAGFQGSSRIPVASVESATPQSTTSATLVDVTGSTVSVTLDVTCPIQVNCSFELETASGAAQSVVALAVQVDGVDHAEHQALLSGTSDKHVGAINHTTGDLPPGTYTVRLRYRRVSGTATPGINNFSLTAMGMQAGKGLDGDAVTALHFDASEFIPSTTAGCGIDSTETATNRVNRDLLTFDPGSRENATVWFTWPRDWATAKVSVFWMASGGTGSAVFGAEMRVYGDGDAIDSAWGTAQTVSDAAASANTHRQTAATAAITPAGTVTAGCRTALRLYRDATNGSDDLAVDALVSGVLVEKAS